MPAMCHNRLMISHRFFLLAGGRGPGPIPPLNRDGFDSQHCDVLPPSAVCLTVGLESGVRPATIVTSCGNRRLSRNALHFDDLHATSGIPISALWILHRLHSLDPRSLDILRCSRITFLEIISTCRRNTQYSGTGRPGCDCHRGQ